MRLKQKASKWLSEEAWILNLKKSGFFDLPRKVICRHPGHNPPNMLVIPPGKAYRHVCPSCGYTVVMYGSGATW